MSTFVSCKPGTLVTVVNVEEKLHLYLKVLKHLLIDEDE